MTPVFRICIFAETAPLPLRTRLCLKLAEMAVMLVLPLVLVAEPRQPITVWLVINASACVGPAEMAVTLFVPGEVTEDGGEPAAGTAVILHSEFAKTAGVTVWNLTVSRKMLERLPGTTNQEAG